MIELELLSAEHLPGVEAMLDDPDVVRFTRIPLPPPPGFAEAWLARYEAARRDGTREAFAIVEDGEFLGVALAAGSSRRRASAGSATWSRPPPRPAASRRRGCAC